MRFVELFPSFIEAIDGINVQVVQTIELVNVSISYRRSVTDIGLRASGIVSRSIYDDLRFFQGISHLTIDLDSAGFTHQIANLANPVKMSTMTIHIRTRVT